MKILKPIKGQYVMLFTKAEAKTLIEGLSVLLHVTEVDFNDEYSSISEDTQEHAMYLGNQLKVNILDVKDIRT